MQRKERHDDIERRIGEREMLGVHLTELDMGAVWMARCLFAGGHQHAFREVHTHHVSTVTHQRRSGERHDARSGPHVEHARTRPHARR